MGLLLVELLTSETQPSFRWTTFLTHHLTNTRTWLSKKTWRFLNKKRKKNKMNTCMSWSWSMISQSSCLALMLEWYRGRIKRLSAISTTLRWVKTERGIQVWWMESCNHKWKGRSRHECLRSYRKQIKKRAALKWRDKVQRFVQKIFSLSTRKL